MEDAIAAVFAGEGVEKESCPKAFHEDSVLPCDAEVAVEMLVSATGLLAEVEIMFGFPLQLSPKPENDEFAGSFGSSSLAADFILPPSPPNAADQLSPLVVDSCFFDDHISPNPDQSPLPPPPPLSKPDTGADFMAAVPAWLLVVEVVGGCILL